MVLQTAQGEAISAQIAGYIDILLHRRRTGGTIVQENEGEVATEEYVPVQVDHIATSTTTTVFSGEMPEGHSQGYIDGGAQIPGN